VKKLTVLSFLYNNIITAPEEQNQSQEKEKEESEISLQC
jgi:hypothetical protein